ncbi:MAG: NifB/NifX family molybdenum-iron cluster-binding protein [archaeon]|nr:NifB/NifX family molybdenum-iron cluster-binding protein [archaeon]
MRIVIPTDDKEGLEGAAAEHFGRCNTYTFLDENGSVLEIIDNTSEHMGGSGLPPELMKKHEADVLLCNGLGPRALTLCKELGIDVYVCRAETVKDMFDMWKNKKIEKAGSEDVCEEHKK